MLIKVLLILSFQYYSNFYFYHVLREPMTKNENGMNAKSAHNFISCYTALETILHTLTPWLESVVHEWHQQTAQNIPPCTKPACSQGRKPSTQNFACWACIKWAAAIEAQMYPGSDVGSLQWAHVNPTLFRKDPFEVLKLFVGTPPVQSNAHLSVEDFNDESLLMIMSRFSAFHNGDQLVFESLQKVSKIILTQRSNPNCPLPPIQSKKNK